MVQKSMGGRSSDLFPLLAATNLCFAEKDIYTQEVLAVVLQNLMEQSPLPTLLMRTVIQALAMWPKLIGFGMNIMQRLIQKQVGVTGQLQKLWAPCSMVFCLLCERHNTGGNCLLSWNFCQVWKQQKVWEGFIKCCQRTKPHCFQVLLVLPAPQLKNIFESAPELREPLLTHVQNFTPHQVWCSSWSFPV